GLGSSAPAAPFSGVREMRVKGLLVGVVGTALTDSVSASCDSALSPTRPARPATSASDTGMRNSATGIAFSVSANSDIGELSALKRGIHLLHYLFEREGYFFAFKRHRHRGPPRRAGILRHRFSRRRHGNRFVLLFFLTPAIGVSHRI